MGYLNKKEFHISKGLSWMKKMKLFATTALSMLMLTSSMVFAQVPDDSIVIGQKAYSIELLFSSQYVDEINQAVDQAVSNGYGLYCKLGGDSCRDIFTNGAVSDSEIANWPQITYKDASGNETVYAEGNGEEVSVSSKSAYVTVEVANALPTFKQVNVLSSEYDNAVSFKVVYGSTESGVTSLGTEVTFMTSESTVEIQLLDNSGSVVATGNIGVATGVENAKVSMESEQDQETNTFSVVDIY
jgi:hypothetical protein